MRNITITLAICVDTDGDRQATQALTRALLHQEGNAIGSVKILAIHQQPQIPALLRARKGNPS